MLLPFRKLAFALANTAAVLAALYVAFALDLERPYWAMFTVFIVANPIAGAVRSKAVYRFLGTFVGASIALLLVPPLVDAPVLLCLAISLWVGACLYLSLLDRTPRSYAFLLAGYTATIVGFAVVNTPGATFEAAVSRIEEISLGLICATIAHSVIFPLSVTSQLSRKIEGTLKTAAVWLSESLVRLERPADLLTQKRLANVVTDMRMLYTHVAFETSDVPRADGAMRLLEHRLALLLPRSSGIQKSVSALVSDGQIPESVVWALETTSHWLRCGEMTKPNCLSNCEKIGPMESAVTAAPSLLPKPLGWQGLLEHSVLTNLRELVAAFADSRVLASAVAADRVQLPAHLESEAAAAGRQSLHRDRGLALLSAFAAAGATLVACLLWVQGSWPEGAVAAQFAAIGCSLFATFDDPSKLLRSAIVGILIALAFAALYDFAILPRVDGFVPLALVLSPAILLFSVMLSSERLGAAGLVLAIAFSGGLALQSTYRADFAAFINSNSAEIVGILVAVAMNLVFRTIDPASNALRISRAGRKAVGRLGLDETVDLRAWTIEMFDRLGLVTSRIATMGQTRLAQEGTDALRDLRVGLNLGTIRAVRERLGFASGSALQIVLKAVSGAYASDRRNRSARIGLEVTIDRAISSLETEAPSRGVQDALAALTGLRLDLAPAGSKYAIPIPRIP